MHQLSVKVTRKIQEAEDIVSFELVSSNSRPLPPFSAGSYIDVHLRNGFVRQYSLCNNPSERHRYLIAVLRDPNSRGGSIAMQDDVVEGAVLQISEPRNNFGLTPAKRSLLFAGGIGVTPILCMAERLAKIDADFELHYCCHTLERTAFYTRIMASSFAAKVHFHFSTGMPEQKLDVVALTAQQSPDTHLYVCGPSGFIDHVLITAKGQDWASEQLHREYFGVQAQDIADDVTFDVKLASTGKVYSIPVDKTIIAVLAEHGIELPVSCEQGVCGTCITRVLEGTPDHRDMYFTDDEHARNDQLTPCCSRSKSSLLVLDI